MPAARSRGRKEAKEGRKEGKERRERGKEGGRKKKGRDQGAAGPEYC